MKKKSTRLFPYLFCLPFLVAYLLFNFFPTLYSFVLSFYEWNGISDRVFIGADNYVTLFTRDPMFLKSLGNTAILMGISTPLTVVLGMLMAYFLFELNRGKMFYQTVNFFPYITTPVAIGFIFSYLFDWQSGYVNQVLANIQVLNEPFFWLQSIWASRMIIVLMIVWRYLGYYMTIYLAAMAGIPGDLYEAARVDGASSPTIFFKITIPLLRNITTFLVITSIIGGLQMFEEPNLLFTGWANFGGGVTGGPNNVALTTVWKFYNDSFKIDSKLGYGSAISYSLFLVILCFSFIGFKITSRRVDRNE